MACNRFALLLFWVLPIAQADIFKYVDAQGKIYFTDAPLQGEGYRLAWKRTAAKVMEREVKIIARGRSPSKAVKKPGASLDQRRKEYEGVIHRIARQYHLYPELLHAVVRTESAYNPQAVSSAGAIGLMQLMPQTAKRYQVKNIWDPVENLRGGARYLRDLLDRFNNDLRLALAAYNAGENAVKKYGNRIPPYPETQRYVRRVLQFLWAERASAGS